MWSPAELEMFAEKLKLLQSGFDPLPDISANGIVGVDADPSEMSRVLDEVALRLRDNYPYHHPLYIGQMLKPPHPIARLAYALAMTLNPNNHALDGGRASSEMEKESVSQIAAMFGWSQALGHLCSGGTVANLEALWVARNLRPGRGLAASAQAHYTHSRLATVLEMPFVEVAADQNGRMDVDDLRSRLEDGSIGTVVATLGTTAAGVVDPLAEIVQLRQKFDFRLHVDAAYGGYFRLVSNLMPTTKRAFACIDQADSIVVDPHKHGLQPYGCGCVLFRDPADARFYRHDSPYTYFSSPKLHLGEISLECSRPGAAAVALWATLRVLPLVPGGEFAGCLEASRDAALALHKWLAASKWFVPFAAPELDIVVWGVRAETASQASSRARLVFDAAAKRDLYLALARFPRSMADGHDVVPHWDQHDLLCLRACTMKPAHSDWMPEILARLEAAMKDARRQFE